MIPYTDNRSIRDGTLKLVAKESNSKHNISHGEPLRMSDEIAEFTILY